VQSSFKFQPTSFSWVAIHPQPKGVIQFIGGAFFGTFPTIFYRYFLSRLFEEGYTIVALPFRFSFRHWSIAISLLKEQEILRQEISSLASRLGYQNQLYQDKANYFWLGHSLGCKYIALLEFLSSDQWQQIIESQAGYALRQQVESSIESADLESAAVSILNQPSLLLAPDISDTESAIPVRAIATWLDRIGLGVLPTRRQTQQLIQASQLFNLTAMISFNRDTIAGSEIDQFKHQQIGENSDVLWLMQQLEARKLPIVHTEIPGKHLEPLGQRIGNFIVDLNPWDKFIQPLHSRQIEQRAIALLAQLKHRQSSTTRDKSRLRQEAAQKTG
jgi:Protein of unknown function (DUF1350)